MPITTQQHFEQAAENGEWPSRYDATKVENYNFITRREAVATLLAGNRFDSVLDLGCGSGDNVELLSSVAREYVGVDYSPAMIKRARQIRRGSSSPAEPVFVEGNAESLPFDADRFDLVCAIGFIQYFPDPTPPMREIVRVLKPGGTLVIQSFQEDFFRAVGRRVGMETVKRAVKAMIGRSTAGFSTDRAYAHAELDELMAAFHFTRVDHRFNNYHVLPKTLRRVMPRLNVRGSELFTRRQPRILRAFAVNYVGRYRLDRKAR